MDSCIVITVAITHQYRTKKLCLELLPLIQRNFPQLDGKSALKPPPLQQKTLIRIAIPTSASYTI